MAPVAARRGSRTRTELRQRLAAEREQLVGAVEGLRRAVREEVAAGRSLLGRAAAGVVAAYVVRRVLAALARRLARR